MPAIRSHLVIIAGPNGAGKTTTAPSLLKDLLGITEFVNADLIAQGLSAFQSEAVAFQAGRIMLQRLRQVVRRRYDRGIRNFFQLYQAMVDQWWFYDNSHPESPVRIASGKLGTEADIIDQQTWNNLMEQYR